LLSTLLSTCYDPEHGATIALRLGSVTLYREAIGCRIT
jgi:hypothetical protein